MKQIWISVLLYVIAVLLALYGLVKPDYVWLVIAILVLVLGYLLHPRGSKVRTFATAKRALKRVVPARAKAKRRVARRKAKRKRR